jgi:NADH:ubiquinone oxidoreductase subunit H
MQKKSSNAGKVCRRRETAILNGPLSKSSIARYELDKILLICWRPLLSLGLENDLSGELYIN